MNKFTYLFLIFLVTNFALSKNQTDLKRPNVLIIMVDDLGFSDLGCYGSEIETPVLDKLAENGLRFSQFYNTAKCHSSRISLLTGQYCYQAGDEKLSHAVTSAEVLSKAGYTTMMSGKWHLDKEPTDFGFDRYFGHLSGSTNYYKGNETFRLNGKLWNVPENGFYTTIAKVDYALEFLKEARSKEKPWYLYIAFNAPHEPLQPLKMDYEKYMGKYTQGWDSIVNKRLKKIAKIKLFKNSFLIPRRPSHIPAWENLNDSWKIFEEKRMTALAGMIDRVDQEIGRVVSDLEKSNELNNTLILFVSDNGACPFDRKRIGRDLKDMPYKPDCEWRDSTGWAWARNSPFKFYKQNQYEGGITTPAIIHWPAGLKTERGQIADDPVHLVDVLPTLLEITGAQIPKSWPGRALRPLSGVSIKRILDGQKLQDRPPLHFLFKTDRAIREGDWKLVSFRSQPWELYHIGNDRAEMVNLALEYPNRVRLMADKWITISKETQVPEKLYKKLPVGKSPVYYNRAWSNFKKEYNEE